MKFKVSMKDPDTLYDAISDAVKEEVKAIADPEEREAVAQLRCERTAKLCSKWFSYGEYLTVEIDTDAGTIAVVPT